MGHEVPLPLRLVPAETLGELETQQEEAPIGGATWYLAKTAAGHQPGDRTVGDGLAYHLPQGALAKARYLTFDLLVDTNYSAVFTLNLLENGDERIFSMWFSVDGQCQARVRMPLEMVNQNRFVWPREGAVLRTYSTGDRVDLSKVDRMTIKVLMKSEGPLHWCMTPVTAMTDEPEPLTKPLLPKGPLLDEMGQSALLEWPNKSHGVAEVVERLHRQLEAADRHHLSAELSRWGGWKGLRFEATGFFRTQHDGRRWWLVDPDGFAFWSVGPNCVTVKLSASSAEVPEALTWMPDPEGPHKAIYTRDSVFGRNINYLTANLIRAFGPEKWYECWGKVALAELRRLGFNTIGNWHRIGTTGDLHLNKQWPLGSRSLFPNTPRIYRDFLDVFDPRFAQDAAEYASLLKETADDPAMIGYFLDNEPSWVFTQEQEPPAAGMLFNTTACASRIALSGFLRSRYGSDKGISTAWGVKTTLQQVAKGEWRHRLNDTAKADLTAFSTVLAKKLWDGLSAACRKVDPNHLNLGVRYHRGVPTAWLLEAMGSFDVFTSNNYHRAIPAGLEQISAALGRPVLVSEWGNGALDAGMQAAHILMTRSQEDRGRSLRTYTEEAASKPWCVGVHWYQCYDGFEHNYGLIDRCHRPYKPVVNAAKATNDRIYAVALGETEPYSDPPEYPPPLWH
jgi:hypothetical protein